MDQPEKKTPRPGPIPRAPRQQREQLAHDREHELQQHDLENEEGADSLEYPLPTEEITADPAQQINVGYGPEDYGQSQVDVDYDEDYVKDDDEIAGAEPGREGDQTPGYAFRPPSAPTHHGRGAVRKNIITSDMFYDDADDEATRARGAIAASRRRRDMVLVGLFGIALVALGVAIFVPIDWIGGRPEEAPLDPAVVEDLGIDRLENLNERAIQLEMERQTEKMQQGDEGLGLVTPTGESGGIRELLAPTIGVLPESTPGDELRGPGISTNPEVDPVQMLEPETVLSPPPVSSDPAVDSSNGAIDPALTPEQIQKELQDLELQVMEKMQDQEILD